MGCSVMILAKNEAANIAACIASCSAFADEVVVIDDFSTDDTKAIAEALPKTRVLQRALTGDFGAQQSFGIAACREDWVFMIDADERVTPALSREIEAIVKKPADRAYWVTRINHFAGQEVRHGPLSPDRVLRLVPRAGTKVEGLVHQKTVVSVAQAQLSGTMKHYTYRNWEHYERKMVLYSTVGAQKYFESGKRAKPVFDVVMRPWLAFFKMYVLKRGFLDGTLGWMLCHQYANYTMAKYIKLAELARAKERP